MNLCKKPTKNLDEDQHVIVGVYGTLRREGSNHFPLRLDQEGEYLGDRHISAKMYDVSNGGFPGILPLEEGEDSYVLIELYRVKKSYMMRSLDRLEGYYPDSPNMSMYIRKSIPSKWDNVYVYIWNGEKPDDKYYIEDGDWIKYKKEPVIEKELEEV